MLGGVCSGIAEYANMDASAIRLFYVLFSLACGLGVIAYICAWLIMPSKPKPTK
jgi:phage shock protein C